MFISCARTHHQKFVRKRLWFFSYFVSSSHNAVLHFFPASLILINMFFLSPPILSSSSCPIFFFTFIFTYLWVCLCACKWFSDVCVCLLNNNLPLCLLLHNQMPFLAIQVRSSDNVFKCLLSNYIHFLSNNLNSEINIYNLHFCEMARNIKEKKS